jgi:hypothetical protein
MTIRSMATIACSVALLALATGDDAPAGEDFASIVEAWGESLELDARVVGQVELYSQEEDDLGQSYPAGIAADVRRLIFEDAVRGLSKEPPANGEPAIDVDFLDAGFVEESGKEPDSKHQRKFEEGFIRIEVVAFFEIEGVTPEEALKEYTSKDLRMKVSSRIARIWTEDDLSCVEVKGVKALLSPTLACNLIDELVRSELASQHSQVVSNPGGKDYQTVYFKESIKTFVAAPGGLVLHYINYTRAVKLGSIKRALGRGKIEESEEKKIRELQNRLSDGK